MRLSAIKAELVGMCGGGRGARGGSELKRTIEMADVGRRQDMEIPEKIRRRNHALDPSHRKSMKKVLLEDQ